MHYRINKLAPDRWELKVTAVVERQERVIHQSLWADKASLPGAVATVAENVAEARRLTRATRQGLRQGTLVPSGANGQEEA